MNALFGVDPSVTYPQNSTNPSTVAAFDTDATLDYAGGPVPLDHVTALRDDPEVAVYATGHNQSLRDQAEIPGIHEINDALGRPTGEWVDRADRMRLLSELHPDADRYVVVDDVDLRELEAEGWRYYQPAEYAIEELDIPPEAWVDRFNMSLPSYFSRLGVVPEQFPTHAIRTESETPYTDRVTEASGPGGRDL